MINVNKPRKIYEQDIWHEWEITGNTLSFRCESTNEYIIWENLGSFIIRVDSGSSRLL
jgi:hypothetical protein